MKIDKEATMTSSQNSVVYWWRRNASAVHRSAVNLDSWTRREENMSPSLKSAFFLVLSALIKVRRQSPAWAIKTNLTRIPSSSQWVLSLFGLDSWDDSWTSSNRWYRMPHKTTFAKFADVVNSTHDRMLPGKKLQMSHSHSHSCEDAKEAESRVRFCTYL